MKNKLFFLCTLIFIQTVNSMNSTDILIATQYKIIENGYIMFLETYDHEAIETIYSYSIKDSTVFCMQLESRKILNDIPKYIKKKKYFDSETFNNKNKNTWRAKYFSFFSHDFLVMNNKQKKLLLDCISKSK